MNVIERFNTVDMSLVKDNRKDQMTFKELYESLLDEIKWAKENGNLDELMNTPIYLSMTDLEAQQLDVGVYDDIGWLSNERYLLLGNFREADCINPVKFKEAK